MNILLSETRKIFSVRATWVYLLLIAGGMASGAVLNALAVGTDEPFDISALAVAADLALIVIAFAAAMTVGADLSKGTIAWTYLSSNHRITVLVVQTLLILVAILAAATFGMMLGFLGITALGGTVDLTTFSDDAAAGYVLASYSEWTVFTLLAALLATILRSGTFAAMLVIADIFVVEVTLGVMGPDWLKPLQEVLPLANSRILATGSFPGFDHGQGAAALILGATVTICLSAAAVLVRRRAVR